MTYFPDNMGDIFKDSCKEMREMSPKLFIEKIFLFGDRMSALFFNSSLTSFHVTKRLEETIRTI